MQAKHTEKTCSYCDQILNYEQELAKHHRECKDLGVANSICSKCNEKFNVPGLRRHQNTCHGARGGFNSTITEFGLILGTIDGHLVFTDLLVAAPHASGRPTYLYCRQLPQFTHITVKSSISHFLVVVGTYIKKALEFIDLLHIYWLP